MFTPSTVLRLLWNIDIDNEYANTFTFANTLAQSTFFIGKTFNLFTDFTYMRKEKSVRVHANIETMFQVSYMMFQNANFGSKWFYAFITDMKYINDETTEISFEIDVIQTWYFDVDIKNCYIEREHVANDNVGAHLVEENLNVGDYVIDMSTVISELIPLSIVISTTASRTGGDVQGAEYTGVYSGNLYIVTDDYTFVNDFISDLSALGKADAINNIFLVPSALVQGGEGGEVSAPTARTVDVEIDKNLTALDGYVPKNKKLYTYPYNFLSVSNNHGCINNYKYELSDRDSMEFYVSCDVGASPTVYLIPKGYKCGADNMDEFMTLTGYPLCNWTTDIFKIWQAQNAVTSKVGIAGSALALVAGGVTGNPLAIAGGVIGVANSIGGFYEKSIQPNPIKGEVTGGGNVAMGIQNFTFFRKTIRAEFARIIDNFFDRFGYKVNELKTPNFNTRANWNYLKTLECNISGNIPNNDLRKIHSIFRNGITFWHNDNVGDYDRSNAPI